MDHLFFSNTEALVFAILSVPVLMLFYVTLRLLSSRPYMERNGAIAKRLFEGEQTRVVRIVLFCLIAITFQVFAWKMVATLVFAIALHQIAIRLFFWKSGFVNLSCRKY